MSLKYAHVFDLFEKLLCLTLPWAAVGVSLYFITSISVPISLGVAAGLWVAGRLFLPKLLRPISTWLYLFIYCGTIVSYMDAAKMSFLLDGSMSGQWWTLSEIRNIPFRQRKELLYQFAESKGAARFSRKEKPQTQQAYTQKNKYKNSYHQNTQTQQDAKPIAPQYTEQYIKACSLFDIKPAFTENELKESYHNMIKQYHPDLYANAAPEIKRLVEDKSREIISAYNYLLEYRQMKRGKN
jgi:hypothetical protein